jgi:hypothetical protein
LFFPEPLVYILFKLYKEKKRIASYNMHLSKTSYHTPLQYTTSSGLQVRITYGRKLNTTKVGHDTYDDYHQFFETLFGRVRSAKPSS